MIFYNCSVCRYDPIQRRLLLGHAVDHTTEQRQIQTVDANHLICGSVAQRRDAPQVFNFRTILQIPGFERVKNLLARQHARLPLMRELSAKLTEGEKMLRIYMILQ